MKSSSRRRYGGDKSPLTKEEKKALRKQLHRAESQTRVRGSLFASKRQSPSKGYSGKRRKSRSKSRRKPSVPSKTSILYSKLRMIARRHL